MKKKILFIGRLPPPIHGAALMNQRYIEDRVLNEYFDIRAIRINDSESLEELGKVNLKKILGFFKKNFRTIRELLFFNPDLIYFEIAPKGFAFYRDSIFVWLCKLFSKKIVFQLHAKGISSSVKSLLAKKYYRQVFRNSKVILLSWLLYEDVKEVIYKNQIIIMPNRIENELTEKEFNRIIENRNKNKKPVLLFLSNMIETKGPLDVLEICNELNKKRIDFECLFVGKFQDREFEKRFFEKLKEFKLGDKCKYLGAKYGKEKFKIFEKTNYLIFPTRYAEECFPVIILETLMWGIPILSYDNGAIKEMMSKDYLGFVAEQGDLQRLSLELIKRLKKKENPKKIREYFKKNYVFEKSRDKLKEVLK
jgi:glycosyltransferase involved in cell wall biosynthesis